MTDTGELRRENEALRERIARLSAAILRISASLDVVTVLQEVADSARALTGARYGLIATVDEAGEVQDFVSSGITPDEHRQLVDWPHGPQLFEHLRNLPGAVRLADLPGYIRSLGYPPDLIFSNTLQATPMRHRGLHVGNFFLGEKEGGQEFTEEDEEVLVLFASQAATAIANARTYRDERRARADLEALVETSPVGVVVFDAGTGHAVSFIGEAFARSDNVSIADFGTFTPQDPRSGSCATPRSRSALVAVVALLSGAGRRGSVTARVPTPRPGASVRPPQRGPGRHAQRSSTVSHEPIGSPHRVTLLGQLHAERRRRATRPPAPPLRRSRRHATLK